MFPKEQVDALKEYVHEIAYFWTRHGENMDFDDFDDSEWSEDEGTGAV